MFQGRKAHYFEKMRQAPQREARMFYATGSPPTGAAVRRRGAQQSHPAEQRLVMFCGCVDYVLWMVGDVLVMGW